jgi:hypothetical protein
MHRLFRCSAALVAALTIYEIVFFGFGAVVRQITERQQSYAVDRPPSLSWAMATPVGF